MGNTVTHVTLKDLEKNKGWSTAVIVFSNDSWERDFSLESRSYVISRNNKYFGAHFNGNSLFGSALDGSDDYVRLDYCLHEWIIEYCYILK